MKIQYEIAYNGHKRGMNGSEQYAKDRPGTDPAEAFKEWVELRFGTWIKANLSEDYIVCDINGDMFVLDFLHDTDATEFKNRIGGRVREE